MRGYSQHEGVNILMYGRKLRSFHHAYYHGTYVLRTECSLSRTCGRQTGPVQKTDWPLEKRPGRPGDDASPLGEDASPLGEPA